MTTCSQQKGGGRKRAKVHPEPRPGRSQCDDCLAYQHDSGRTRGLLCNNCNRALGMFGDDPAVLQAAIDYLGRDRA